MYTQRRRLDNATKYEFGCNRSLAYQARDHIISERGIVNNGGGGGGGGGGSGGGAN